MLLLIAAAVLGLVVPRLFAVEGVLKLPAPATVCDQ
jgi:hypothetical protein